MTSPVTAVLTQRCSDSRIMSACGSSHRPSYMRRPRRRPSVWYCARVSSLWIALTRRSYAACRSAMPGAS
ncbi:Uncharacterised protein [Mycobacteroides abscessus]|nr:Uncharacterised protein [Mycobacteroides abscessus]